MSADAKKLSTSLLLAAFEKAPKRRLLSALTAVLERDGRVDLRAFLEGYFLTRKQCGEIVALQDRSLAWQLLGGQYDGDEVANG
jgi:hypothetical protein